MHCSDWRSITNNIFLNRCRLHLAYLTREPCQTSTSGGGGDRGRSQLPTVEIADDIGIPITKTNMTRPVTSLSPLYIHYPQIHILHSKSRY